MRHHRRVHALNFSCIVSSSSLRTRLPLATHPAVPSPRNLLPFRPKAARLELILRNERQPHCERVQGSAYSMFHGFSSCTLPIGDMRVSAPSHLLCQPPLPHCDLPSGSCPSDTIPGTCRTPSRRDAGWRARGQALACRCALPAWTCRTCSADIPSLRTYRCGLRGAR